MTEAILYIPGRHIEPFVNIQKSFSMVSEERTNKHSIISVATASVADDDSDTGKKRVTLPPLPSAHEQYKGLERQRKI